ncbi:beta-3-deoxy-D-manno-oct-2-ulosonic acid transferase [Labrenzia sp. CP4]|uniref:capsular polysaccharide export protein, LipB/KpsS family n=1 Tax=Labrenzia sp. CP4 TaxID=1674922 RepID=UPI00078437F8|nr:beta-3-deoxy-D-manno-oct-2-ulosonic acid transferase [Labrenzia sp. CP4]
MSVAFDTLIRQFVTHGRNIASVCDFTGTWREQLLSSSAAGETAISGAEGLSLQRLLTGDEVRQEGALFWTELKNKAALEQIAIDDLLNWILSCRTAWFSPYTGDLLHPGDALVVHSLMQEQWQDNAMPGHCYGAQYWNHPSINATFSGKGGAVTFHETQQDAVSAARSDGGRIYSWAGRTDPAFEQICIQNGIQLSRIEDGFLRSVGLGAGLARGAMLAVDDLGIYYDPSRPSRLEVLLKEYVLSPEERNRGEALIDLIIRARVSKYNFGKTRSFAYPANKEKILVPGQVADDAAIRKSRSATIDCANTPNVNLDLLRLARARHREAFLVFKPHPDVETGLRKGKVPRETALEYADEIAEDANIIDLIEAVDGVETFSSLSGFEALLRGKKVCVHGAPFYAGWGLCEDLTQIEGRGTSRTLPELVYLALVKYARTIDPVSLLPCSPEFLVARLAEQRTDKRHLLVTAIKRHSSWLGRKLGI